MKVARLVVCALASLAISLFAQDQPPLFDPDGLSLIIGGNGSVTTKGPTASIFGANASLVQTGTLGLPFQLGIRQTLEHQRLADSGGINLFTTALFYDVIFLHVGRKLDFAAGANCGLLYGNTTPQWRAGPEVGIRWWIRPNAAIVGRIDYPFNLSGGRAMNVINYFIGFQVSLESKTK